MKKSFYYAPVVKPIASNGSAKFGFKAFTKSWTEENPSLKFEVEISGKTREELETKINSFFKDSIELKCEYYLCSKSVVEKFKPIEVSKPFKSGYEYDQEDEYFVAWLNFEEVEKFYKENEDDLHDFFCNECVSGQMDVSKISIKNAKKVGFWVEIENKLNLTLDKNRAMIICNMAQEKGITLVELINKL